MNNILSNPRAAETNSGRVATWVALVREVWGKDTLCKLLMLGLAYQTFLNATSPALAQQHKNRGWIEVKDDASPGKMVRERTLTLYPSRESRPALKYRLIPSEFDRTDGNAAVNYLRAMGFMEQNTARSMLDDAWEKASAEAREQGLSPNQFPPYLWQNQAPDQLDIEEVKKHLMLTDFQVSDLATARMLKHCDFNRDFRNVDNPFGILLPEVQQLRGMARDHSLRCRVAIAEGRFEDAFAMLGQQYAMVNHLTQDGFAVSLLVGNAIAGIAWEDALDVVQMPQAPNLYWALATLPKPITPVRAAFAVEKELPFLQLKPLQEVDETPRPTGYWFEFIDRILVQYNYLAEATSGRPARLDRFTLVNLIGAGYPGARQYLIETEGLDSELVDSYPMAQVFFLAQKKYLEQAMDEQLKWSFLDYSSLRSNKKYSDHERRGREQSANLGWAAAPAELVGPAILQVWESSIRIEASIALLQTIEAIRMYAAENENRLPHQLSALPYPAPADPATGQPIKYQLDGETALLTWEGPGIAYRLKIQLAK